MFLMYTILSRVRVASFAMFRYFWEAAHFNPFTAASFDSYVPILISNPAARPTMTQLQLAS